MEDQEFPIEQNPSSSIDSITSKIENLSPLTPPLASIVNKPTSLPIPTKPFLSQKISNKTPTSLPTKLFVINSLDNLEERVFAEIKRNEMNNLDLEKTGALLSKQILQMNELLPKSFQLPTEELDTYSNYLAEKTKEIYEIEVNFLDKFENVPDIDPSLEEKEQQVAFEKIDEIKTEIGEKTNMLLNKLKSNIRIYDERTKKTLDERRKELNNRLENINKYSGQDQLKLEIEELRKNIERNLEELQTKSNNVPQKFNETHVIYLNEMNEIVGRLDIQFDELANYETRLQFQDLFLQIEEVQKIIKGKLVVNPNDQISSDLIWVENDFEKNKSDFEKVFNSEENDDFKMEQYNIIGPALVENLSTLTSLNQLLDFDSLAKKIEANLKVITDHLQKNLNEGLSDKVSDIREELQNLKFQFETTMANEELEEGVKEEQLNSILKRLQEILINVEGIAEQLGGGGSNFDQITREKDTIVAEIEQNLKTIDDHLQKNPNEEMSKRVLGVKEDFQDWKTKFDNKKNEKMSDEEKQEELNVILDDLRETRKNTEEILKEIGLVKFISEEELASLIQEKDAALKSVEDAIKEAEEWLLKNPNETVVSNNLSILKKSRDDVVKALSFLKSGVKDILPSKQEIVKKSLVILLQGLQDFQKTFQEIKKKKEEEKDTIDFKEFLKQLEVMFQKYQKSPSNTPANAALLEALQKLLEKKDLTITDLGNFMKENERIVNNLQAAKGNIDFNRNLSEADRKKEKVLLDDLEKLVLERERLGLKKNANRFELKDSDLVDIELSDKNLERVIKDRGKRLKEFKKNEPKRQREVSKLLDKLDRGELNTFEAIRLDKLIDEGRDYNKLQRDYNQDYYKLDRNNEVQIDRKWRREERAREEKIREKEEELQRIERRREARRQDERREARRQDERRDRERGERRRERGEEERPRERNEELDQIRRREREKRRDFEEGERVLVVERQVEPPPRPVPIEGECQSRTRSGFSNALSSVPLFAAALTILLGVVYWDFEQDDINGHNLQLILSGAGTLLVYFGVGTLSRLLFTNVFQIPFSRPYARCGCSPLSEVPLQSSTTRYSIPSSHVMAMTFFSTYYLLVRGKRHNVLQIIFFATLPLIIAFHRWWIECTTPTFIIISFGIGVIFAIGAYFATYPIFHRKESFEKEDKNKKE